ncbi:hypothetical protein CLOP_g7598 [Closterium sp. NIES-67]|nr:hypothetical protein CLOP_g7598 [Closterium sp. NIES-67]
MNERGGDANGRGAVAEKASEPPPSKVEALDGSNYEEWSGRMRSAFKRYKLLKIAVGEEKMPEEGEARERWIEKSAVLFDLILQSVNKEMFEHIKDLVEADDSGPRAWKLLRDVIQPNTLPMVIVLEKELAAISMRPRDDVKPALDKIKDTYARMAAAGSSVSQLQQCTKIISVLDNSWDNLIPTLNSQQDQWTPEWLRQQILQEDFRRRHVGGGAATKTAEGYGAAGRGRGRGGWRGRGRGRSFGRGRGRGDYNEGHGSSSGRGSTRMEGTCWYCKKVGHPWFKCFSRPEGWAPPGMKPPSGERAQGGAVQDEGAQGNAYPGMYLMVEDVHGHEGDVGSVGKVVMHPLTHWVIDSGCTSHMTPRADLLDEVKPPGKIKYVAAASGALLPVIGVGNAKVKGANGELVGLGNVLLVKGLSANLLSVALVKNRVLATVGDKEWIPYIKWYGSAPAVNMLRAFGCMVVFHVPKEKRGKLEASGRWGVHLGIAKDHKGWLLWDLTTQKLTVSRDVKFLESLYYKEWKQQQQKLPSTPLIVEADEVQQPSRQVEVAVSEEEMSGVTEEGGAAEVVEQQQQHESPPRVPHPPERPRRDVRPPVRLTYGGRGKPNVVQAGSVVEQIEEDEIAHCYWAPIPEPKTREEALNGPNGEKWKASEDEEFGSLIENETWDLCDLPPGKKAITSKMIYRHKYGPEGELTRYKSRLVARGFQQTKGKDYDEVFAPVGKGTTLRVLLAIAALLGWKIRQMDIVTAFLNGIILEEVYMKQPEGLDDGSGRVCRLKKAIYGLKQAPRAWYHKLEEALVAGGFKKSECDPSLFLLQEKDEILMLLVYMDDILLFSASTALLDSAEQMLEMQFKCSKMGEVKYYLGMHVERDVEKGVLRLHQRKYCEGLAEKYGLQDGGKPATPLPSGFTVEPCADEEVVGESDRKLVANTLSINMIQIGNGS